MLAALKPPKVTRSRAADLDLRGREISHLGWPADAQLVHASEFVAHVGSLQATGALIKVN
jgi:hypothetical protein